MDVECMYSKKPKVVDRIKAAVQNNNVFAFNLANRDRWIIRQAAMLPSGSRVLDVGAGSCPYRKVLSHCDYRTQDLARLNDRQLRFGAYGNIDYVCDATNIPVEDASFDAILCAEVLEHHPEPINVVKELGRILRPGGKLILTAPLGSGIHQEPFHYYGGYTPYWYKKFLSEAGFVEIIIEANAGFFKFYSQESIRFIRMSQPLRIPMPHVVRLLWLPVWVVLAPVLGIVLPMLCHYLDRFDFEKRFTVGYHVTAVKR